MICNLHILNIYFVALSIDLYQKTIAGIHLAMVTSMRLLPTLGSSTNSLNKGKRLNQASIEYLFLILVLLLVKYRQYGSYR